MIAWLNAVLIGVTLGSSTQVGSRDIAITFALGDLVANEWSATDVRIAVSVPQGRPGQMSVEVADLRLAAGARGFSDLVLRCDALTLVDATWRCDEGRLDASNSPIGQIRNWPWQGQWDRRNGLGVTLLEHAVADGTLAGSFSLRAGTWAVRSALQRVRLDRLWPLFPALRQWSDWNARGRLTATAEATGVGVHVEHLQAGFNLSGLEFASPDGLQAVEDVALDGKLNADWVKSAWQVETRLAGHHGQVYVDPVFVDVGNDPLVLQGKGRWIPGSHKWAVDHWSLHQGAVLEAAGTFELLKTPLRLLSASTRVRSKDLDRLYRQWLQPFLIDGLGGELRIEGAGEADAHWDLQGPVDIDLRVDDLTVQERAGRFAVEGVKGVGHWRREQPIAPSHLQIGGGRVYLIPIGAFETEFRAFGPTLELLRPLDIPLLGGAIRIAQFYADGAERGRAKASVVIDKLDLEALTAALEWPRFRGTLSGHLPDVSYEDGVIQTNDGLSFSAFDGEVTLRRMVVRDVFGVLPALAGEVLLRGLDLAALTETFSVGRIEGRLDGDLRNLELLGWQPNRFDLHLYTPAGSTARRQISQRAVANLTELGTGIPRGLPTTVLRIFDEFRYDKIDIRIGLRGDTAELGGLDAPGGGYYLVRGAGLPRIDVIGRNRQVSWTELIRRLKNIRVEGMKIK